MQGKPYLEMNDEERRAPSAELSRRRRLLVLGICSMSLLIVGLDVTIVNVALPAIHQGLSAPLSGLQWIVDAYTLVLASLLMLSGSMADRLGRRRVFQTGLAIFSIGSLLCALAPNLALLVVFRILQAIGASMLNPVAMSIIRNVFTDPRERAQAIGVWGAVVGVSMALGPIVGGLLVDSAGWRAIFLVNLPVGIAAVALTALFVPESRAPRPRAIDPVGQLLVIGALASLTYSIIEGPRAGWASPEIVSLLIASAACFALLVPYEVRRDQPLIEVRFFKSAPFAGVSAIAVCAFAVQGGFLFLNTLYLQNVRGLSPFDAGLSLLPMALMTLLLAPVSGALVARGHARAAMVIAAVALIVASLMLTTLSSTTPVPYLLAAYFLFGVGLGMINPPITNTAVSGMPASQAGVAAAVASTSRQVGATMGVAVLGSVAGAALAGPLGNTFAAATHTAWWITTALGTVILVLSIATTSKWADDTARETADELSHLEPEESKAKSA